MKKSITRVQVKTINHNSLSILLNGEYDENWNSSTGDLLGTSTMSIETNDGVKHIPVIIFLDDYIRKVYTIPIEDFEITAI